MFNFLEKIKQKPEHEKRRILIVSTSVITAFIVLVWASLLYVRYLETSQQKKTIQHTASPFGVFFKDMGERMESLKNGYKSVKDIISEVSEEAGENFAVSSSSEGIGTTTEPENQPSSAGE